MTDKDELNDVIEALEKDYRRMIANYPGVQRALQSEAEQQLRQYLSQNGKYVTNPTTIDLGGLGRIGGPK